MPYTTKVIYDTIPLELECEWVCKTLYRFGEFYVGQTKQKICASLKKSVKISIQ